MTDTSTESSLLVHPTFQPGQPDDRWTVTYPRGLLAEHQSGVCGDAAFLRQCRPQASDYPMPPMPKDPRVHALQHAADELGWRSGPLSFAINTRARATRSSAQSLIAASSAAPFAGIADIL